MNFEAKMNAAKDNNLSVKEELANTELGKNYEPQDNEEYMCSKHLKYFQNKLLDWRKNLLSESERTLASLTSKHLKEPDDTDRAANESATSLALRTRERYFKLINKIDKALLKIENGTYGYCDETGEEIGLKRLEARPVANLTIEAQEQHERKEKQMSDNVEE